MRLIFAASLIGKVIAAAIWSRAPFGAAVSFFSADLYLLYCLLAPSSQRLLPVRTRFATERREVLLTIDDGPDPEDTPRILALLDRFGARAAFFLIGEKAARHPELVAEILRRGHEVGHH